MAFNIGTIDIAQAQVEKCDDILLQEKLDTLKALGEKDNFKLALEYQDRLRKYLEARKLTDCNLYYKVKFEKGRVKSKNYQFEDAFTTFQSLVPELIEKKQYTLLASTYIEIELLYEFMGNLSECKKYLDKAWEVIENYDAGPAKPQYYIRLSSYSRFINEKEAALNYAMLAKTESQKYNDTANLLDSYLLIGLLSEDKDVSVTNLRKAKDMYLERGDRISATAQYINISKKYENISESLAHLDSAYQQIQKVEDFSRRYYSVVSYFYEQKKLMFLSDGALDSAYRYVELQHEADIKGIAKETNEKLKFKEIEFDLEQAQLSLDRLEKNRQNYVLALGVLCSLLGLLVFVFLLFRRDRKRVISQAKELESKNESLLQSNRENEILLTEIHHRVKNSLQNIIGIINFKEQLGTSTSEKNTLVDLTQKIYSIALIHDQLYREEEFESIYIKKYVDSLTDNVESIIGDTIHLTFEKKIKNYKVNLETTMPLGILLSELITNSIKHNSKAESLTIRLHLSKHNNLYTLKYSDNGIGIILDELNNEGTGMRLIHSIRKQLRGEYKIRNENGFIFEFTFREKKISRI